MKRCLMTTRPGRRLPGAPPAAPAPAVPPAARSRQRHRRGKRDTFTSLSLLPGHLHIVPAAARL